MKSVSNRTAIEVLGGIGSDYRNTVAGKNTGQIYRDSSFITDRTIQVKDGNKLSHIVIYASSSEPSK